MRVVIVGAILAVLAAGCGSKTPTNPSDSGSSGSSGSGGVTTNHGSMTAKIDGVTWNATLISEPIRLNGPAGTGLTLSGSDLVTTVTIGISPLNSTGTYTLNPGAAHNFSLTDRQGIFTANNLKGSGSVTLTTITPAGASAFVAKGTFTATVVGSGPNAANRTITGGSFDITY